MKNGINKFALLFSFLLMATFSYGQNADSGNILMLALAMAVVIVVFFLIIQVADNLMRVEARNMGMDGNDSNFSIFPAWNEIFRSKVASFAADKPVTFLKAGHDILLEGTAKGTVEDADVKTFAIQPPNFIGISPIPKLAVEIGASVKAGDVILFDKVSPEIKHVAPVSGKVVALNRGEKRSVAEVVIEADGKNESRELAAFDLENGSREDLVNHLLDSGVWPMIRQRPFNIIANPTDIPANIFVSTFDTAPLAVDLNVAVEGRGAAFQKGLDALGKLTAGNVYLGLSANGEDAPSSVFTEAKGVEKKWYHGAHPAGNVGIQIHHTAPVDGSKKAWTMGVQDVITLGNIFLENRFDAERVVAIGGAEVNTPKHVRTCIGANIGDLINGNLKEGNNRIVSGNLLSGEIKTAANFLNVFDSQISVAKEGDYYEMFGWLVPLAPRPSISASFPNGFFPDLKFEADTNTHGEKRAFVVTGQYESVLPMDVYPQHLMKAILVNDFERMEGLGIYELVEEDVALCEFACTSKQPLQKILRDGLDIVREQG